MKSSFRPLLALALPLCLPLATTRAQTAPTLTVLHSFNPIAGTDGQRPDGGLIQATDGNFYGTTNSGSAGQALIYRITPDGTVTLLHQFATADGSPSNVRLLQASDGNFYGTGQGFGPNNHGTVYRMTPAGDFTVLHGFTGTDGDQPLGELIQARDGNLYGTTRLGGTGGAGTIFRVSLDGAFTSVASLSKQSDGTGTGNDPQGGLIQAADGNFYGATKSGPHDDGTDRFGNRASGVQGNIFRLTPDGTLTNFTGFNVLNMDPQFPNRLIQGRDGSFYGTASGGGANADGAVYKVAPDGTITTLHSFSGASDGRNPLSELFQASDGSFYGTTQAGGTTDSGKDGAGTIFKITSDGVFTTLHVFALGNSDTDGRDPMTGLIQASDGNLYGTTDAGGSGGFGTVYRLNIAPAASHAAFFNGESALSGGAYYLQFPGGNPFGYYSYLSDAHYVYHFDLGYEYVFDAADSRNGVYLYDFKSGGFFYTSPSFPFPYLYDFSLGTTVYYYPDPKNPGRYNTDGVRYFYRFDTGAIFSK